MSGFTTPGFLKLWFINDYLETKYASLHEIPVIDIHKKQTFIPLVSPTEKIAIIHYQDSAKCQELKDKLGNVKDTKVLAVADQNSKESFLQIRENLKGECLGKMVLNGPISHPLFKFLKKNCSYFYEKEVTESKKISQKMGVFVSSKEGIKYYKESEIDVFVKQSLK